MGEEGQWDEAKMFRAFKASGTELTLAEWQAEFLDNGELGKYYKADERDVARYEGLHYSEERGAWIARFHPARPDQMSNPRPDDATYSETLNRARLLHEGRVKPSQSFKALTAFDVRFDREAAKIDFPQP